MKLLLRAPSENQFWFPEWNSIWELEWHLSRDSKNFLPRNQVANAKSPSVNHPKNWSENPSASVSQSEIPSENFYNPPIARASIRHRTQETLLPRTKWKRPSGNPSDKSLWNQSEHPSENPSRTYPSEDPSLEPSEDPSKILIEHPSRNPSENSFGEPGWEAFQQPEWHSILISWLKIYLAIWVRTRPRTQVTNLS